MSSSVNPIIPLPQHKHSYKQIAKWCEKPHEFEDTTNGELVDDLFTKLLDCVKDNNLSIVLPNKNPDGTITGCTMPVMTDEMRNSFVKFCYKFYINV